MKTVQILLIVTLLATVFGPPAEAARPGSHRVGGHGPHGRGSHYVGGHRSTAVGRFMHRHL